MSTKSSPGGKSYEYLNLSESMIVEVSRNLDIKQSLPADSSKIQSDERLLKMIPEEFIKFGDVNFHIFFEGCRTNNTFVLAIDPMIIISLFKLVSSSKHTLAFAKIVNQNKAYANSCEGSLMSFFRCMLQFKNEVSVDCLFIPKAQLTVMDSVILAHKKIFESKPSLNILSKDSDFYRQFLEYYAKN
jgi:hypothetical protein